jgi:hypothetical protein
MSAPNGQRIGVKIPAMALEAAATIRLYFKGTLAKRSLIDRADNEGKSRGISQVPPLEAIELAATGGLKAMPAICLRYPAELEDAVVAYSAWTRLNPDGRDCLSARLTTSPAPSLRP